MMENLTKENCFNALTEKYPRAMELFCEWIDFYKVKNNWKELFNTFCEGYSVRDSVGNPFNAPKYHELPYAMQLGIWFEFVRENGGYKWDDLINSRTYNLRDDMDSYFEEMENPS
jgi:hypothetical protein